MIRSVGAEMFGFKLIDCLLAVVVPVRALQWSKIMGSNASSPVHLCYTVRKQLRASKLSHGGRVL